MTFQFCSLNWINRRRRSKFSELVPNPFSERSCNKICSNQIKGRETYIVVYTCTPIPVYLGKLQICTIKKLYEKVVDVFLFLTGIYIYRKSVFPTIIRKRNLACFSFDYKIHFQKNGFFYTKLYAFYDLTRHLKRLEFKILSVSDIIK